MTINVSRFINRRQADFSVEVLTPMFLGGADGHGELRAPPLKNALRYWWRLTMGDISGDELLSKEQKLFGGVKDEASRSLVDIVVSGDVKTDIGRDINIGFKENPEANNRNVSLAAYLGMGPVHFSGSIEKKPILPGQKFDFSVTYPQDHEEEIMDALSLFAVFGSLGSRSRNGWGGIHLVPAPKNTPFESMGRLYKKYGEEITTIFAKNKEYPFKLAYNSGKNEKRLAMMWKIAQGERWQDVMQTAGERYMDARQVLKFPKTKNKVVQKRHIVGYPVTNHPVEDWDKSNGRMPSQLRIVVRRTKDIFYSYFLHLPHRIPHTWDEKKLGSELSVWQELHTWLNKNCTYVPI